MRGVYQVVLILLALDRAYTEPFSQSEKCIEICWRRVVNGSLEVGVLYSLTDCYCTINTTHYENQSYYHKEFFFSLLTSENSIYSISQLASFMVRIRFLSSGSDKTSIYFIDNLDQPVLQSGRMILTTSFLEKTRSDYQQRSFSLHALSNLYNAFDEVYSNRVIGSEIESFYSFTAKVADMAVENNHTEWVALKLSTNQVIKIRLIPFIISFETKSCGIIINAFSNVTQDYITNRNFTVDKYNVTEKMYVNFTLTTSTNCTADLEDVAVLVEHDQAFLAFESFVWHNTSVAKFLFDNSSTFFNVTVSKLFIDSIMEFSATYCINTTSLNVGDTNITVNASIYYTYYNQSEKMTTSTLVFLKEGLIKQAYTEPFSQSEKCIEICWRRVVNGSLEVGVLYSLTDCYCTINTTHYENQSYYHKEFFFSLLTSENSIYSISQLASFMVRIRFLSSGSDKTSIYFIDNLDQPVLQSGRMILTTSFLEKTRSDYQQRSFSLHALSNLYNAFDEVYSNRVIGSEIESFYSFTAKVADMAVENNHTEWVALKLSTNQVIKIRLIPFIISFETKSCGIIINAFSNVTQDYITNRNFTVDKYNVTEKMYVNFTLTTSTNCTADLEDVAVLVEHDQAFLAFESFVWHNTSVAKFLFDNSSTFFNVTVSKLFIDSIMEFSATYCINTTSLNVGDTNITVNASIYYTYYNQSEKMTTSTLVFLKEGLIKQGIPTRWIVGYYDSIVYEKPLVTTDDCVQTCWNKTLIGDLVMGASYSKSSCFCFSSTENYQKNSSYFLSNFNFSFISSPKNIFSTGDSASFMVRVRYFTVGNDTSTIYFVDDIKYPINKTGRILLSFENFEKRISQLRTLTRDDNTKIWNAVQETWIGEELYTVVENLYSLNVMIGDMSVQNNHTEWAVLVLSNIHKVQVTLTPFNIMRAVKNCSLQVNSSSELIKESMSISFLIKTSSPCTADLENLKMHFHHVPGMMIFNGFVWDDLSLTPTSFLQHEKFNVFYVQKLFIGSMLNFSVIYKTNITFMPIGTINMSVVVNIWWDEYLNGNLNKTQKILIFQQSSIKPSNRGLIQMYPELKYTSSTETSFVTSTYQFVCVPMQKWQQAPCYQRDLASGLVQFLPVQLTEVIGFNSATNLVFGYTFRNNIVEVNMEKDRFVTIITQKSGSLYKKRADLYQNIKTFTLCMSS